MAARYDEESFKKAISALPLERQRALGARFARNVLALATDPRLKQALESAENPGAPEAELMAAYRTARGIEVDSYTACGHTVDWAAMASHYVAASVAACLAPATTTLPGVDIPAYDAAMNARMARSCQMLARGDNGACGEMEDQFTFLDQFLQPA